MLHRNSAAVPWRFLLGCLVLCLTLFPAAVWGQQTQGTISVTVVDPTGGLIPDAQFKLVDVVTNDTRSAKSLENGTYSFVNLKIGAYKLTVTKTGFNTQVYNAEVMAGRTTDIKATLQLGKTEEVVEVVGMAAPIIESSSSAINSTITPEQIDNLPLSGRNVNAMSRLVAGYNGTFVGLPTVAQGANIDGAIANTGRWKYSAGADSTSVTPRLESIQEMTVSTSQLDLAGYGTSSMQITYVTKRGENTLHGSLYEDHRNSALNAKPWSYGPENKKSKLILNEFGGTIGGPIKKDKLFFFGSFSMSKQPNAYLAAQEGVLASDAQNGIYKWLDDKEHVHSVNLYDLATAYNGTHPGSTLLTGLNGVVQNQFAAINDAVKKGTLWTNGNTDPNLYAVRWSQPSDTRYFYPTVRLDYLLNQNHRLSLAYNETKRMSHGSTAGFYPGDGKEANYWSDAFTAVLGVESTLTPTLINNFKFGYFYSASSYPTQDKSYLLDDARYVNFAYGNSGLSYNLPVSQMQPIHTISNDTTWMKGKHTLAFGFSIFREQDRYWDAVTGIPSLDLGYGSETVDPNVWGAFNSDILGLPTDKNDPNFVSDAGAVVAGARNLYSTLAGRVLRINGDYAADPATLTYPKQKGYTQLNELMKSVGLYVQDSYKIRPNLTLNYGLRWDFVGVNKDLTGFYHNLQPKDVWAYSGVGNLFNPGSHNGIDNPTADTRAEVYKPWKVTPQPAVGLAWTPRSEGNFIEKLLGGDKTVIRAGYSLRRFTEPQQFVYDVASNHKIGYFQNYHAQAGASGAGTFPAGSIQLGATIPDSLYNLTPGSYSSSIDLTQLTFNGGNWFGINSDIRQPYTQSWNVGFQRDLGKNRALEVRYVGSRTIHQWLNQYINEVNIFENGFLNEFQAAQKNLALNGGSSFAYNPAIAGSSPLPIMTAAAGGASGFFTNADYINSLRHGAAGSFASTLAYDPTYFCNMSGANFGPCKTSGLGTTGTYAANFFMANPYAIYTWGPAYMNDTGYSNYNSLQMEFRQQKWHGLSATGNYTWSKTLGYNADAGDWVGFNSQYTLRDNRSGYAPASTDIQHVVHVNATYDLPFGKGKQWLSQSGVLDRIVGGWTVSTIVTVQSGTPFRIGGLYQTFNDMNDGGVVLDGVTAGDIQKHIGVYQVNNSRASNKNAVNTVYFIDPEYAKSLLANGNIVANETAGTWGKKLWLHGPHRTLTDIAITKSVPVTERVRFRLQTQLINAFNHPVFQYSNTNIGDTAGFGRGRYYSDIKPRNIEFRANIEF